VLPVKREFQTDVSMYSFNFFMVLFYFNRAFLSSAPALFLLAYVERGCENLILGIPYGNPGTQYSQLDRLLKNYFK